MDTVMYNGKQEVIFGEADLLEIIEKGCGEEVMQLTSEYLADYAKSADYNQAKVDTDLDYYAAEIGHLTTGIMDALEILREMEESSTTPRINRANLFTKLREAIKLLENMI